MLKKEGFSFIVKYCWTTDEKLQMTISKSRVAFVNEKQNKNAALLFLEILVHQLSVHLQTFSSLNAIFLYLCHFLISIRWIHECLILPSCYNSFALPFATEMKLRYKISFSNPLSPQYYNCFLIHIICNI